MSECTYIKGAGAWAQRCNSMLRHPGQWCHVMSIPGSSWRGHWRFAPLVLLLWRFPFEEGIGECEAASVSSVTRVEHEGQSYAPPWPSAQDRCSSSFILVIPLQRPNFHEKRCDTKGMLSFPVCYLLTVCWPKHCIPSLDSILEVNHIGRKVPEQRTSGKWQGWVGGLGSFYSYAVLTLKWIPTSHFVNGQGSYVDNKRGGSHHILLGFMSNMGMPI